MGLSEKWTRMQMAHVNDVQVCKTPTQLLTWALQGLIKDLP